MKMTKPKWTFAIGALAMITLGIWIRELASWRPVFIGQMGNVGMGVLEMRVSHDGRFLWARDADDYENAFALQPLAPSGTQLSDEAKAFKAAYGRDAFPHFREDLATGQMYFTRKMGQAPLLLRNTRLNFGQSGGWSLARNEIYTENQCVISIWNMKDGSLKRRVRYANGFGSTNSAFSPDGKWLLATQANGKGIFNHLRRFDVQSGKLMASPNVKANIETLQFSHDGKFLLFGGWFNHPRVILFETSGWKKLWSDNSVVSAGWSPDDRVGFAKANQFEWRDAASGALLQSLIGPTKNTRIWTPSPNGKWIYSAEQSGVIRKWRAR